MALVNKSELAEIVGKTTQTLTTWQKNGMPIFADGRNGLSNQYQTADVIQWMIDREISKLSITGSEGHDYEQERARLTHHQANKTALEERQLKGELIHVEKVEYVWGKFISAFRSKCLAVPSKIAPRVQLLSELAEIEQEIRTSIYDALEELSEFRPEDYGIRSMPKDDSEDCTTAEFDG